MGLWRLVTAALGNGSCGFKWHRLNFLQPWTAEALSAGLPRGCAPLKAPREGVSSFFWLVEAAPFPWLVAPSSILSQETGIFQSPDSDPPASLSQGLSDYPRLSRWVGSCVTSPAQGPQLNPVATIPLPQTVTRSQVLGIRTQTPWGPSLSRRTEEQPAEVSQAPSSSRQPGAHTPLPDHLGVS